MLGRLEATGTPKGFVPLGPGPRGKLGGLVVGLGVGPGAAPGAATTGVATIGAVPTGVVPTGKWRKKDVVCGRGLGLVGILAATGRLLAI